MHPSLSFLKGNVCVHGYMYVCRYVCKTEDRKTAKGRYSIQNLISLRITKTCCSEVLQMGFLIVVLNVFGRE